MTDGVPIGFKPHPGDFIDAHKGWHRWTGPKHRRAPSALTRAAFGSVMLLALSPALFLVRSGQAGESVQAMPQWEPGVQLPAIPEVPADEGLSDRPKQKAKPKLIVRAVEASRLTPKHRMVVPDPKPVVVVRHVVPLKPVVKPVEPVQEEAPGAPSTPGTPVPSPVAQPPGDGSTGTPGLTPGSTCQVGSRTGRVVKAAKGLICKVIVHCNPPSNRATAPTPPPNTPPTPTPTPTPQPDTTKINNGQDQHGLLNRFSTPAPLGKL